MGVAAMIINVGALQRGPPPGSNDASLVLATLPTRGEGNGAAPSITYTHCKAKSFAPDAKRIHATPNQVY